MREREIDDQKRERERERNGGGEREGGVVFNWSNVTSVL